MSTENPTSVERFLDPAVIAGLQGLHLRAKRIVEGYVAGLHKSPFHGFSIEFAEHREYAPGDDLRYVDWKVYGKSDKVYLKQYEEETNLIGYLLLDISESMQYQGPSSAMSKLEYAQCLAAALAYLILHQQDSAGLATFDDEVRQLVRPSSNPAQLMQLLKVMEASSAERKTRTGPVFHELAQRLNRRGVAIVISDLFDDVPSILEGLKHLRYRKHDLVVLHVVDPAEIEFPFQQTSKFQGLESLGDVLVEPEQLRRAYRKEFEHFLAHVRSGCRAERADYLLVRTDQPFDLVLSTFLAARRRRQR